MALRLRGATSGYIELKAPASAGDNTLTLPTNNGSANQLLKTDGSGNLSWTDDNSGVSLSGSTNNTIATVTGANALQGEANLTFDGSVLNVAGNVDINNGTGQAHYEISQTNGNTVKFGLVSGSNIELSGSSNNDFYIKLNGNNERLRIDSSGRVLVGHSASVDTSTFHSKIQVMDTDAEASITIGRFSNDASATAINLSKSRATNKGSHTDGELHDNDGIGNIFWWGSDGSDYEEVARIGAEAEALFTGSSTPGALTFHTTASNATTASERLRLTSTGVIQCGTAATLKAEINNAVSGHQFISQCSDNNNGFEIYQQHGSTATRNTLAVYDNRGNSGAKQLAFAVRGDGLTIHQGAICMNNETTISNQLNDYERGSYTPTCDAWGSFTVGFGYYVIIGDQVTAWGFIEDPSSTTSGNAIQIGLPVASSSNTFGQGGSGGIMTENVKLSDGNETVTYVLADQAKMRLYHITDSGWATVNGDDCGSTSGIYFNVTYYTS